MHSQEKLRVLQSFITLLFLLLNILQSSSSVINNEQNPVLYDDNDKVLSVNSNSFQKQVLGKKYVILFEFYNSFCGHCKRFAPKYKELAEILYPWKNCIKVMAIDCFDDENNGICREYEVMGYPSLRYFNLNFKPTSPFGLNINSQDIDEIRTILAQEISKENATLAGPGWPNFTPISAERSPDNFFEDLSSDIEYGIVIFSEGNQTLATEMILEFQEYNNSLSVRRVGDPTIANKFKLNSKDKIAVVRRTGNVELLTPENDSYKAYKDVIKGYLKSKHLYPASTEKSITVSTESNEIPDNDVRRTIEEVKAKKHLVYYADLEQAIRNSIFREIPKRNNISGDELVFLQKYINLLNKYNPLTNINGKIFLRKLNDYVNDQNHSIKGLDFEIKVKSLASEYSPVFSSKRYVGCIGSRIGLRGFTCSLWTLFHYLTVQDTENNDDSSEVLQTIYGYVNHFFGCTDCSKHFQEMSQKRDIWASRTKDEAVLWLWEAHNEVNERLKGDSTEDPEFLKVQFPTKESCEKCYKGQKYQSPNKTNWNKKEVLQFIKYIYNPNKISQFKLNEDIRSPISASQKSMKGAFSNLDLTMGMVWYFICIVMMVVAVKLFVHKGYRKKYDLYKV